MSKVLAVLAAVVALLAPASVAQASSSYILSVDSYSTAVYAPADGYLDTTEIHGNVYAGGSIERIRGSVVITVSGRAVKSFAVTKTGPFVFTWDGHAGDGSIVPGLATVTLRVDGAAPVSDTLMVSAKQLVRMTKTTTQSGWLTTSCSDSKSNSIHDLDAWGRYIDKICPTPRNSRGAILRFVMSGRVSSGALVADIPADMWNSALTNDYRPATVSITAKFSQSGSGTNSFYLCKDVACSRPTDSTLRVFTMSGTYTTTGTTVAPEYPHWKIVVGHGHDLSFTKFTIKTTYWVLK